MFVKEPIQEKNSEDNQWKSTKAMNPSMKEKIEYLIGIIELILDIIQLIVDNHDPDKIDEATTLLKLLSLDISPCLQRSILKVLINFFTSTKVSNESKRKTLSKIISNNLLDTILYMMSISLIDVRCECLKLFKEMSVDYLKDIISKNKIYEERLIPFVTEYILPTNLLTFKRKPDRTDTPRRDRGLCLYSSNYKSSQTLFSPGATRNSFQGGSISDTEVKPATVFSIIKVVC